MNGPDPTTTHPMEGLPHLNVVDGRDALAEELAAAPRALRADIGAAIHDLMRHRDFDHAVQATVRNNRQREKLIFQRLDIIAAFNV